MPMPMQNKSKWKGAAAVFNMKKVFDDAQRKKAWEAEKMLYETAQSKSAAQAKAEYDMQMKKAEWEFEAQKMGYNRETDIMKEGPRAYEYFTQGRGAPGGQAQGGEVPLTPEEIKTLEAVVANKPEKERSKYGKMTQKFGEVTGMADWKWGPMQEHLAPYREPKGPHSPEKVEMAKALLKRGTKPNVSQEQADQIMSGGGQGGQQGGWGGIPEGYVQDPGSWGVKEDKGYVNPYQKYQMEKGRATEETNRTKAAETKRHNLAMEKIYTGKLSAAEQKQLAVDKKDIMKRRTAYRKEVSGLLGSSYDEPFERGKLGDIQYVAAASMESGTMPKPYYTIKGGLGRRRADTFKPSGIFKKVLEQFDANAASLRYEMDLESVDALIGQGKFQLNDGKIVNLDAGQKSVLKKRAQQIFLNTMLKDELGF